MSTFKERHPFEQRCNEAKRIRAKYPDRIPIIVEMAERSSLPPLDKCKYLVPANLTIGQFVYIIRKRIRLTPEQAIFIFVDDKLPSTAHVCSDVYEEHKDPDGFLYCSLSAENTFGAK